MDLTCYNSYYEVNLSVLEENFKKISRFIAPAQVIPVLKADAYGMGALEIARVLTERCGCRTLACSQTYEGLVLREGGITDAEILIMGPVLHDTLPHAVRWDMQIPLFTSERVRSLSREAARQGKTVKAQIKIETGLNRIGAWPGKQLQEVIDALHQCPNIQVVGAFTHFAQAETPEDAFTKEQFAVFKEGVAQLEEAGFHLSYIHCCNTGASEWYREALDFSTHIRAGSLVLGYSDIADGSNPMGLQEMLSWRTTASFIRHVEPGETVSYDRLFKAEKPTDIAVVSVGFADGILDGTIPPEKERESLQVISSETRRLSRLVRRMLELSRLQSSERVAAQEQFDAAEVLLRVLVSLEAKITEKELDVQTELPDGPVMVWGDPDAVTQVCYNLLDNAVKFAVPQGRLSLRITTKGGKAYIAIGNEGETIPPQQLSHIFDRFHKADSSRSTHKDGVGLGLYIVKTLLNTYKEDITVTSQDGFTEFTFTLSEV